jgi:ABC-type sugar transport system permease subunit
MPGLASAVSVVFMVIVLTISLIQMRVLRAKGAE